IGSCTVLAGFRTRHSLSSEFTSATDWARTRLQSFGFAVATQTITVGGSPSSNLVADKSGTGANRRLVIATAHLDSINISGGAGAPAPGADDNASGSAGVVEIGRVLGPQSAENDLRLILFGGEEEGLHGSRQYVAALTPADRARLDAVINMDMIGTLNVPAPTVLLEGAPVSQQLMNDLSDAANEYTSLTVQTSLNPFASDHVPFINAGLPALLTIEGSDSNNTSIHTANDTLDKVNGALAAQIVRMNVAVLARRLHINDVSAAALSAVGNATADLTGDHSADIVGFGDAGVWVSLNNGNGTFKPISKVIDNFAYLAGGWRVEKHPRFLADLTGDERSDILGFGDAGVWVSLNNGNGTFKPISKVLDNFAYTAGGWRVEKHPRFLADLTGDGRADIVGFGDAGVWVSLNNGDGTFQPATKVLDNFAYVAGGWRVEKHPRFLADLTGDSRADIAGFGDAGVWVSLNNGNGTLKPINKVIDNFAYTAGGWRVEKHPRFLAGRDSIGG
ncbi:MAG: M28 family peptidase, partial [Mycetocola sp.]